MSKAVNMKKLLLCFFAAVFAICLSAGLMTGCSSNESKSSSEAPEYLGEDGKFVVGFDETFKPFGYKDDNGEYTGFDLELAKAVCEKMGYDLEIVDTEFDSLISGVASGKYDFVMAGMTVTEERKQMVSFSDTYATGVQVIIVKDDSPITSVDDLLADGANYTVGTQNATTGCIYAMSDIEDAGKGTVAAFPNGNEAVMALVNGKIDCVIIDNEPAKAYVAANEGLKILDSTYVAEDYAACFAKDNTELVEKFNAALEELTADGTIPAIIEKYIPAE